MKWIVNDGHRYAHQLFHHMIISKTGIKLQDTNSNNLREIDFRNIGKQLMIKRLRKLLLENPDETDQKKWKISKRNIKAIYPNALQFVNEKEELVQFGDRFIPYWMENMVKLPEYKDNFVKNGFDSMDKLIKMTLEEMEEIGIDKAEHRDKIRLYLNKWEESLAMKR